jgi:hypothetical protein
VKLPANFANLYLCTTIQRDIEHERIECDVLVYFTVTRYVRGHRATWTDPAQAPEFEFDFVMAEFDGGAPDEAPDPLTVGEVERLESWFKTQHTAAAECAVNHGEYT